MRDSEIEDEVASSSKSVAFAAAEVEGGVQRFFLRRPANPEAEVLLGDLIIEFLTGVDGFVVERPERRSRRFQASRRSSSTAEPSMFGDCRTA